MRPIQQSCRRKSSPPMRRATQHADPCRPSGNTSIKLNLVLYGHQGTVPTEHRGPGRAPATAVHGERAEQHLVHVRPALHRHVHLVCALHGTAALHQGSTLPPLRDIAAAFQSPSGPSQTDHTGSFKMPVCSHSFPETDMTDVPLHPCACFPVLPPRGLQELRGGECMPGCVPVVLTPACDTSQGAARPHVGAPQGEEVLRACWGSAATPRSTC